MTLIQTNDNQEVDKAAKKAITTISLQFFSTDNLEAIFVFLDKICTNWNWHTRNEVNIFIRTLLDNNVFLLLSNSKWIDRMLDLLLGLLQDEQLEVRVGAGKTLQNFFKYDLINLEKKKEFIAQFKEKCSSHEANSLVVRHAAILGLCAVVDANMYSVPSYLPDVILFLSKHLNDPQPIQKSANETLSSFMKTHQDNWVDYKVKFTADQLAELAEVSIFSHSYIS